MCLRIYSLYASRIHIYFLCVLKSDPRQALVPTHTANGKFPHAGWRCKKFTYVNHDIQVDENAWIYFAKNPNSLEILVNFFARGSSSGWHSGVLSEGRDRSMFFKFNCKGDEQDLKNPNLMS